MISNLREIKKPKKRKILDFEYILFFVKNRIKTRVRYYLFILFIIIIIIKFKNENPSLSQQKSLKTCTKTRDLFT
jgi:hypothetical protein